MAGGLSAYQQAIAKGDMALAQKLASGQMGYEQAMAKGGLKLGQDVAGIRRDLTQDIYGTEQEWERSQRDLLHTLMGKI